MVVTQKTPSDRPSNPTVTWEKLPDDFQLDDTPVENTGQPLLAGALREALELAGQIQPEMLIASNFGLCATVNGTLVIKAPDWVYVPSVLSYTAFQERRSYTPHLEGANPLIVMEFLSETDGGEYSARRIPPLGKWFYYEQILQVPIYAIFEPESGHLEVFRLQQGRYEPLIPDADRYWIAEINLFLGTWQGEKEGRSGYWLRWWDTDQNLLLWGMERIEQERQRAEQERQRAEQERQRAERLAEYLRSQGINPDDLS
ncbi:MAG: Uma2 family endonuclease [Oscillatoriophycideae cyanobacterium NC_groundwater_1537_Pr4_S-0.65um_50_18]|nr:Uma2 family endonuclease [Oscillatoriophycideae cyanobacterium NC_groundwater_1537_Pr4_S-0.65um_50_18]